jgi:hypothetical protein
MVFGKNSDRPPSEMQVVLGHRRRKAGGALDTQYLRIADAGAGECIASHPTWLWGAEHGFNEHGVAIGNEKIWTVDDPRAQPAGLLGMDLVRLGLERARDADDALSIITAALAEHGQGGSGEHGRDEPYFSSFLIADARGGWVIETSARTWAARPVGEGSSISNRISLGSDWTKASPDIAPGADFDRWRSPAIPTSIADHRLAATSSCVTRRPHGAPEATVAEVVATLRDHGSGPWGAPRADLDHASDAADHPLPPANDEDNRHITVCMHLRGYQATTASTVVDLRVGAPPRAWACLGSPCSSIYVPLFGSAIPSVLSDPAQWQRFARLRDRAEQDPEALVQIRRSLAPAELELWADAESAHTAGTHDAKAAYATRASARVNGALADLGV